jgi:hypothetical protein
MGIAAVRIVATVLAGLGPLVLGALGGYATLYTPQDDKAKYIYFCCIVCLCVLTFAALVILLVVDHFREKERDRRDEMRHREQRELMLSLSARIPSAESTHPSGNGTTLRLAGLDLARRMRQFLDSDDGPDQTLLDRFWAQFPFKELDDLKERFGLHLGFTNIIPSTYQLPSTRENIRYIAADVEREAGRIAPDVPL